MQANNTANLSNFETLTQGSHACKCESWNCKKLAQNHYMIFKKMSWLFENNYIMWTFPVKYKP